MPYPDFLEIQLKSFHDFFQLDTTAENRKNEGLYKVFTENFPITDTRNNFVLEFIDYYIDPPRYSIEECLERGLLLAGDTVFFERNLKVAYVGGGQREGAPDCGLLPVAFDKPRFAGKSIRVLRSNGVISLVEFSGKKQSCAEFAEFLRQSTPGPEDAWALVLENARAIDFADGL